MQDAILWQKISLFELDDPDADFSFSDRLARENGWSLEYTIRTTAEYKKFMYLLCVANHPLTPSDQVDQVWHLHLIYTKLYWDEFCRDTIGRQIHHGPTKGGSVERGKFTNWYAKTKEVYTVEFGTEPPPDIWPDSETRFKEVNFLRVNINTNWIVKKPAIFKP
jgi:hypothetical protein